jgi:pilus assembly protein CpaB
MLTVALAALLAVLGIVAVLTYVGKANQRAIVGMKAISTLVAKDAIPAGTSAKDALHKGLLVPELLPTSSVPADAVHSVTPDIAGLVTSYAVQPGQLLLHSMLVPAAQVTGAIAIPQGKMAVTVQVCLQADVAGYVQPGSYIAVFDTYGGGQSLQQTCDVGHQVQPISTTYTRMLLPKVEVLSVAAAPASQSTTTGSGTVLACNGSSSASQGTVLVTLAASQADAERLVLADQAGLLYFGLLTPSSITQPDSSPTQLFK